MHFILAQENIIISDSGNGSALNFFGITYVVGKTCFFRSALAFGWVSVSNRFYSKLFFYRVKLHPVSKQLLHLFFKFVFHQVFGDLPTQCRCVRKCWKCRGDLEFCLFGSGSRDEHRFGWWTKSYPSGRIMAKSKCLKKDYGKSTYPHPNVPPPEIAGFIVVGLIEGNGCFKPNKPWSKCRQFHERIP